MTLQIIVLGVIFMSLSACSTRLPIKIVPEKLPSIGKTLSKQDIFLGGFSSLVYMGSDNGKLRFFTLTDRGPNADAHGDQRPFMLPDYKVMIVELLVDESTKTYSIGKTIKLKSKSGEYYSGVPQKGNKDEKPVDIFGKALNLPAGIDSESLAVDSSGNFWVGEEGSPAILRFDKDGNELIRWNSGDVIPEVYADRSHNKGFEGLCLKDNHVFAFLQSPLEKEGLKGRLLEVPLNNPLDVKSWFYNFESKKSDKIGDATVGPDGKIYVLERDGQSGSQASKKVFEISFNEKDTVTKRLIIDLAQNGYPHEKAEGLVMIDEKRLAIVNDNDFGVDGEIDFKTGKVKMKEENPEIWIFTLSE